MKIDTQFLVWFVSSSSLCKTPCLIECFLLVCIHRETKSFTTKNQVAAVVAQNRRVPIESAYIYYKFMPHPFSQHHLQLFHYLFSITPKPENEDKKTTTLPRVQTFKCVERNEQTYEEFHITFYNRYEEMRKDNISNQSMASQFESILKRVRNDVSHTFLVFAFLLNWTIFFVDKKKKKKLFCLNLLFLCEEKEETTCLHAWIVRAELFEVWKKISSSITRKNHTYRKWSSSYMLLQAKEKNL